ncbi:D-beta-hydroxybutyrate dehydrogenase like protein [Argiope bruennichi]|uniref:D-beta-hydroxybutyrate dehydrogenase like protein n=2 Tax=Argiope bruennichi TaxID=94029 RepID=A0A8T0EYJ7_ARGBR|nr:D-beta-hydroxybutyrate dehydrogenase like protein [Argiope bruennichi]
MGHRMARRFDELGMVVFAGCLQPEAKGALELKSICSKRLHIVPMDITNDEQVRKAVEYVEANLPPRERGLYCLVNNAGILAYTDFELMTFRMCEEIINVNLTGTIRVTKHFLPLICRSPGRIVTITSIHARSLYPRTSLYTATKYAQEGFFSSLRYELQEKGVLLSNVEPGNFSRTTDIMQWTQRHLDEMWNNLSPEEQESKSHLFEKTKETVNRAIRAKSSESEQEANYKYLLPDVEDAVLAEEPQWRYISAPLSLKIVMGLLLRLPEKWSFALSKKMVT